MDTKEIIGRLLCLSGDFLGERYRVLENCSSGSFSNVYVCKDTLSQKNVIIKGYKKQSYYKESAVREVTLMKILNKLDADHSLFVKYLGCFQHHNHMCVVLEKFGPTLYDAFAARDFKALNGTAIRCIMHKLLEALKVLHDNGIIHTDLKLENVLLPNGFDGNRDFELMQPSDAPSGYGSSTEDLTVGICDANSTQQSLSVKPNSIDVRLIDFGSLAKSDKWNNKLVTTRPYRAPEIMAETHWGKECDIWSLGCILIELALGNIVFEAKDDIEHLFLIQHMISPLPMEMCKKSPNKELRNALCGNLINPSVFKDEETRSLMMKKPPLVELLHFDEELCDIALKMLNPNPFERPSVGELLEHNFFKFY